MLTNCSAKQSNCHNTCAKHSGDDNDIGGTDHYKGRGIMAALGDCKTSQRNVVMVDDLMLDNGARIAVTAMLPSSACIIYTGSNRT